MLIGQVERVVCNLATHAIMPVMAKKKSHTKKHRFKHSAPVSAPVGSPAVSQAEQTTSSARPAQVSKPQARPAVAGAPAIDFGYVKSDLRRIGVMVTALVAFELVASYLLGHTGLGSTVYGWFKV